jgi:methylated-DNA-[protein]-cysteine S-methyltransferase
VWEQVRQGRAWEQVRQASRVGAGETGVACGGGARGGHNGYTSDFRETPSRAAARVLAMRYTTFDSPVGELLASADGAGRITGLHFLDGHRLPARAGWVREERPLAPLRRQLEQYFAGERREFELELAPSGTSFQLEVWRALRAIPYGDTASYGEIAAAVGQPGAARAVGGANNRNPIAIVIPCHRVIGADGTLTGYGGGLPRKQRLLALESGVLALA